MTFDNSLRNVAKTTRGGISSISSFSDNIDKIEKKLTTPDITLVKNGKRIRQLIRWRVPDLGFVDMYINPQQLQIQEKKVIQKQRTKGGYVVQYWGEELTTITIEGNTGASGIEGINILRKVYRAEQNAFQKIEQILSDRFNSLKESGLNGNMSFLDKILGDARAPSLLPTLGSLAVSVELYYQGLVFKGFFESFTVTESASNVGLFTYNMVFTVTERFGERSNFMPWHRQPANFYNFSGNPSGFNMSDAKSTPFSFGGEE